MDLLAPEGSGKIIGGSQREDDLDTLESAIVAKGLQPEDYSWYLDLRRYGSVPHGGFGLGIERTLLYQLQTVFLLFCCLMYRFHHQGLGVIGRKTQGA